MDLSKFKDKDVYLNIVAAPASGDLICGDVLLLDNVLLHQPGAALPPLPKPTEDPHEEPNPGLLPYEPPPAPTGSDFIVQFEDPALEAHVRQAIGKPTGPITYGEMMALTTLDARPQGGGGGILPINRSSSESGDVIPSINSLKGIEYLTRLETLELSGNLINDLRPLPGLTYLRQLYLEGNVVNDLAPLAELSNLRQLDLHCNMVNNVDPLGNLGNLTDLDLGCNYVSEASALSSLSNLERLDLSETLVSDLSFLETLNNLNYLNISSCQARDLQPLSYLGNLIELHAMDIQMRDLSSIFGLETLQKLYIGNLDFFGSNLFPHDDNIFADISLLAGLSNLTHLSLSHSGVADIQALSLLTELTYVELTGNNIVYIDPLVNNPGIDNGDIVILVGNPLDDQSLNTLIPILEERGGTVGF